MVNLWVEIAKHYKGNTWVCFPHTAINHDGPE
jgi:hypothetical protein